MKRGLWIAGLLALIFSFNASAAETEAVVGEWKLQLALDDQTSEATLTIGGSGEAGGLSGTWTGPRGSRELEKITWDGEQLKFSWTVRRKSLEVTATVSGNEMQGTLSTPKGEGTLTGQRAGS